MPGTHPVPTLHASFLELLRCPVTGQRLRQLGAELLTDGPGPDGEQLRYPIREGIPVFLLPDPFAPAAWEDR